ncbi:kynureninase [Peribacillus sp. NPDC097675]|uniref:kynureninase n=1 Tax=Peribacillus sp. NPDC097675 TaxID=3390618 RepID=UPI003D061EBA
MSTYHFQSTKEFAGDLDHGDALANYREEFYLNPGKIYMDGNSLGLLSKRAEKSLLKSLEDWKSYGIEGWTEGEEPWFYFSERLGELSAPLVGAASDEVILTGSTTSNLHQLVATFFEPMEGRNKILADELTFPSDIYALQSQLLLHGLDPETHLVQVKSRDGKLLMEEDIISAMSEEIALIVLPTVLYRSGQILDMARLTKEAHARGIIIGFDGCHSVGAVPHQFDEWEVDFAFWCNYKHVNGGPGSVAGLYVNRKHFEKRPGLTGWFGSKKDKQFDMLHSFSKAETAGAFQIGTPHILSMAPLAGSLEMFAEVGIEQVRKKSLRLTQYLMDLIDSELVEYGFTLGSPRDDQQRGGHIILEHQESARICKALKKEGVIPDYREPNMIRLAPVSLYTSYREVWETVQILKKIMQGKLYESYENIRGIIA